MQDVAEILLLFSAIGLLITLMERDVLVQSWKVNKRLTIGRLFVLNLPLIVLINMILRGWL